MTLHAMFRNAHTNNMALHQWHQAIARKDLCKVPIRRPLECKLNVAGHMIKPISYYASACSDDMIQSFIALFKNSEVRTLSADRTLKLGKDCKKQESSVHFT